MRRYFALLLLLLLLLLCCDCAVVVAVALGAALLWCVGSNLVAAAALAQVAGLARLLAAVPRAGRAPAAPGPLQGPRFPPPPSPHRTTSGVLRHSSGARASVDGVSMDR